MVGRRVDHLPLPGGAPAPKKGGSLPPLPPPPVRRHTAPCEAATRGAGGALRFTAEDSSNPCQLASNADSRAQPGPQRRGLRPLREERWGCQKRAPPGAPPRRATPPFFGGASVCLHRLDPQRRKSSIISLRPRPAFPSPPGRSCPRPRRGRRGVRRCPDWHQRGLAEEPPLLSWPLRVSGCPGLENTLGAVEMVLVPLRRQPARPFHTVRRLWLSVDEPHSLSMLPFCQVFPEGRAPVWLPSRQSVC